MDEAQQKLYQQRLLNLQDDSVLHTKLMANNLSQWLHNIFEADWQPLETFLCSLQRTLAVSPRGSFVMNPVSVKGAKLIDLGIQLGGQAVVLLIALTTEIENSVGIYVQVHPANGEMYLPSNLQLILLSQSGKIVQKVKSRGYDNYIQLKKFKSVFGTSFSIKITVAGISIKEDFVIEPISEQP
jgi:hypothetical protein